LVSASWRALPPESRQSKRSRVYAAIAASFCGLGTRRRHRRDDEMVAVRIGYAETDLRERAKRLGAIWRHIERSIRSSLHLPMDRSSISRMLDKH